MAVVVLPSHPGLKPPLGSTLQTGHPLVQGLVGAWVMNEGGGLVAVDALKGAPAALTNNPTWGARPDGPGINFVAASDQYVNAGNPIQLQITNDITVATHYSLTTAATTGYQLVAKDKDSGGRAYVLDVSDLIGGAAFKGVRFYLNGGSGNDIVIEGRNTVAGDSRGAVGVYRAADKFIGLYINGALVQSKTADATSIPTATANVLFGRREYAGFTEPLNGGLKYVFIWNRVLTADEVADFTVAPYAMFDAPRRFWLDVGTGVAHAAAAALASSGTFMAAPKVNYAAVAALSGTGTLAAASSLSLGIAAALSGAATFSASATVTRNVAAALAGLGALTANARVTYAAQSALAGVGSMAPAAKATYAAASAFAGVATIAADASKTGLQEAEAVLAAVGSVALGARANYKLNAVFAGAGSLSPLAAAQLRAIAAFAVSGIISASASRTLGPSAAFAGSGAMSSAPSLRLGASGGYAGIASFTASAIMTGNLQAAFAVVALMLAEALTSGAESRIVIYGLDNPTPMLYGFDAPTGPRVLKGGV